ncbi:TetR/AcrR family transcriptional regulator [Alkalicoccobacillus porphyridii]|uniref:TetR/AcrR family transcriptional regulator n=1 Tax=Alkalicoccobacillus porphyridii TaxID=2597270 RepID=A0A553ZUW0_9BACI|nr:TetR/AcrR family transcriptional regulator [Alkalicoccobacillus porphyridii]TSB45271.1 TetR/AcrR family transcriptional regulator [Alkalicoccobacillus porphyridii]
MTANDIKQSALFSFGRNGFEGASLAKIAEEVGIKKQSIYTHFKNKDELFLTVLEQSLDEDFAYIKEWSEQYQYQSLHDFLLGYLQLIGKRFSGEDSYRFGLRISFFPPDHLYKEVMEKVYANEARCEQLFLLRFEKAIKEDSMMIKDMRSAVLAYLSILDAIFVELIYGKPERAELKMKSLWNIYWRGITS